VADVAFILLRQAVLADPGSVVAAARQYGLELVPDTERGDGTVLGFHLAGGATLLVALMPFPHPDAALMPLGVTSPPPDEIAAASAHVLVTAVGLTGPDRERDTALAALTGAVLDSADAVAAMLGHGIVFHRARLFADAARLAADEKQPRWPST
jgi:hypothetical protein